MKISGCNTHTCIPDVTRPTPQVNRNKNVFLNQVKVSQSCPTLCNPVDCSLRGSSVHRIPQARILEWVAIPFSRESSQPRDPTQVSCTAGGFFTIWATREVIRFPKLNREEIGTCSPSKTFKTNIQASVCCVWSLSHFGLFATSSL